MRTPRTAPPGSPMPSPPPPQPSGPTGPGRAKDEYLTVIEVADLWHVDKDTVYDAIYAGQLPWVDLRKPGASRARIRVRESAAHQYMKDRERTVRAA
jgi:excisionase family DNA binding protein